MNSTPCGNISRPTVTSVADVLLRFLPRFMQTRPALTSAQRRAIAAITHCRTEAMGGSFYACHTCGCQHLAWHSCNHKACPRCGRAATAQWVRRGLEKRVNAPYFLITPTLPDPLRSYFFGDLAREAYDLLFAAASTALREKLAEVKGFKAQVSGFTAVLHTWGQQMQFHPHLHILVPGAGINPQGKVIQVKYPGFLLKTTVLGGAFRAHFRRLFEAKGWQTDPGVWQKDWGVHIQPAGSGAEALKYLGNYVARSVISDRRIVGSDDETVTFQWKNRDTQRTEHMTLSGVEFVRRYLRHVLPRGLRSIRYYGYCHPAALRQRERVRLHTGCVVHLGAPPAPAKAIGTGIPTCPHCQVAMSLMAKVPANRTGRSPPQRG